MQVLKQGMLRAIRWIGYSLMLAFLKIPIDLLRHRPILNGLWHDWQVASWPLWGKLLGLFLAVIGIGWLVLTLIFSLIYGIKQWLAQQDSE